MRLNKIYIIVGGRGSGKTTFLEKTIKKNSLIVQLFFDDRYKDFQKIKYDDLKICNEIKNRPLILEDSTQLISCNGTKLIRQLLISSKQLGSDIFLVFHSFQAIPPFMWTLFDKIIVFDCAKFTAINNYSSEYTDEIQRIQTKKTKKFSVKGVINAH